MSTELVAVRDLTLIDTRTGTPVLDHVLLTMAAGSVTALTGASGSGKTTLMKAILGWLPPTVRHSSGSLNVAGHDVLTLDPTALRRLRNTRLAFVGQDPGSALNPTMRVSTLLREAARTDGEARRALTRVGLPQDISTQRPSDLSGGQQRRVALARALLRGARIVLVDEPFAGLDATARQEVADALRDLAERDQAAVLVSGHDLVSLDALADERLHLGDRPDSASVGSQSSVLEIEETTTEHNHRSGLVATGLGVIRDGRVLLSGAEIAARPGTVTAVLGESGAGKTTLARILAGLESRATGTLHLDGEAVAISVRKRSRASALDVQLIPQNPLSTLNPQRTVGQILERPLHRRAVRTRSARSALVKAALDSVELSDTLIDRRPHELSGGQRQRVAIARALASRPRVLIGDEVTSALDPETAEHVMTLLTMVAAREHIALIVIGHDLDLLSRHCHQGILVHEGTVRAHGALPFLLEQWHARRPAGDVPDATHPVPRPTGRIRHPAAALSVISASDRYGRALWRT
ncbi:ABC transporter ATP-binding protein [Nocardia sp. NPDC101769]|uniref:ABC transporter ATP-binding protein n=1 Tax=Nocardia sp. NPDC101769 TaxID=3364333 RepID=UPI0037FAB750